MRQQEFDRESRVREDRRRTLLAQAIQRGKLGTSDLSPQDAKLLGVTPQAKTDDGGGGGFGIGGFRHMPGAHSFVPQFLENLLGEKGLEGTVVHLPMGVYEMGKSAVEDISHSAAGKTSALAGFAAGGPIGALLAGGAAGAISRGGKSELYKNVVKPTGEAYKWQYGPLFEGHPGEFGKRFYDRPLGPILDVGTILSGGLGGAARAGGIASKFARGTGVLAEGPLAEGGVRPLVMTPRMERLESLGTKLQGITSREDRRPIVTSEPNPLAVDWWEANHGVKPGSGEIVPPYSNRPLMKYGMQKPFDWLAGTKVGKKPIGGQSLEGLRNSFLATKAQNYQRARIGLQTQLEVQKAIKPFVELENKMPPLEQRAWWLSAQGINSRTKLLQAAHFWEEAGKGLLEEGALPIHHNISPAYTDYLTSLARGGHQTDELVALIEKPTENMVKLDRAWDSFLEDAQTKLKDEEGNPLIDPKTLESREWMVRKTLSKADSLDGARRAYETWRYQQGLHKVRDAVGGELDLGDLTDLEKETIREYGYPIKPKYVPHVSASGFEFGPRPTLRQRIRGEDIVGDAGARLYHKGPRLTNVERAATEALQEPFQGYLQEANEQLFRAGAVRMDIGSLISTASQITRDLIFNRFREKELRERALRDEHTGIPIDDFKNQTQVNRATGKDSSEFVFVPKAMGKYFEGQVDALAVLMQGIRDLEEQGFKLEGIDAEGMQRIIEPLKDHAASFSKDFVGAAPATGYAVPRAYLEKALQHAKAAEGPTKTPFRQWAQLMNVWRTWTLALMPRWWINTAVGSFFMATVHGTWEPKTFRTAFRLMRGRADAPLQKIFDEQAAHVRLGGVAGAERIEAGGALHAHTRGAYNAVQNIEDFFRTAAFVKQLKREDRHSMDEIGGVLKNFTPWRFWAEDETKLAQLMTDPVLVEGAVDEVNRFFYNYLQLGPVERLWVRQFVPFWGWYKFITKFVWRLPVAYPGRANIIAHLGMVGQEEEEQLGVLPDYLRGAIWLNKDTKHLKFLSTFGLNPMAQFANPYSQRGALPGLMGLGQINPAIQAGMQGFGIDPLGGESAISPSSGVGQGLFGQSIDVYTGRPVDRAQKRSFPRFLGSLMRSIPQIRLGEQAVSPQGEIPTFLGPIKLPVIEGSGGRPVYPESIPFLREYPEPVREESRKDLGKMLGPIPIGMIGALTGLTPKQKNQERDARWLATQRKIAAANIKRQQKTAKRRSR